MRVHTNSPIHINGQTRRTLAAKGTLGVDAATIHTDAGSLTLIDVSAVASIRCQGKTRLANALEASILVDTHAVQTHVGGGTLIMINAVLSIRSQLKASIADTLKASLSVDTAAITTHHSIHNTLINIDAGLFGWSSLISLMTLAVVRSGRVDTVSIDAGITNTLIHINTLPTNILPITHVAFAAVTRRCWYTSSVQTQVGEMFAHINSFIQRNSADLLVVQSSSVAIESPTIACKAPSTVTANASMAVAVGHTGKLISIVEAIAIGVRKVPIRVGMRETMSLGNAYDTQTPELI